jgi:hypothetical protein
MSALRMPKSGVGVGEGEPAKIWNKMSTVIEIYIDLKRVKNDKLDENNWVVGCVPVIGQSG